MRITEDTKGAKKKVDDSAVLGIGISGWAAAGALAVRAGLLTMIQNDGKEGKDRWRNRRMAASIGPTPMLSRR
jgi:hypothetical protein